MFFQGSGGVGGSREDGDRFGAAVAKGDFNDDGIFDLAVGAPGEAVGTDAAAGAVNVLNGSSGGLTGGPLFTQSNAEAATGSARPWPRATSTTTASSTWPSARPARTSARPATPAP